MKATLEFQLPEEDYEYTAAITGTKSLRVLNELLNELRTAQKYNGGKFRQDESIDENVRQACDHLIGQVRQYVWDLCTEYGVPNND